MLVTGFWGFVIVVVVFVFVFAVINIMTKGNASVYFGLWFQKAKCP